LGSASAPPRQRSHIAVVEDLSAFVMSMDARLELIIELLGGEDGEEGTGADS